MEDNWKLIVLAAAFLVAVAYMIKPSDAVYVWAGSEQQAIHFADSKGIARNRVVFLSSPGQIKAGVRVWKAGSWYENPRRDEIERRLIEKRAIVTYG